MESVADYSTGNISRFAIRRINKDQIDVILRIASIASFISLCYNTPKTMFDTNHSEVWVSIILLIDVSVSCIFTIEAGLNVYTRGLLKSDDAFLRGFWGRFDAIQLLFHWISILITVASISDEATRYSPILILRLPRVFIIIRLLKVYLKFKLPRATIKNILKQSSKQIYNVTSFFLFFVTFYGLVGVQLFGNLSKHCVRNTFNSSDKLLDSLKYLAIPDTHCSGVKECPQEFQCIVVKFKWTDQMFLGFDNFLDSLFTVYEAVSLECWTFTMYDMTDATSSILSIAYFTSMIFMLAWLVKNVFIAVVIETFAELRVQFQQIFVSKRLTITKGSLELLASQGNQWKFVSVNEGKTKTGRLYEFLKRIQQSSYFHTFMLFLVAIDALTAASVQYDDNNEKKNERTKDILFFLQMFFTFIFDIEAMFKIFCLGFKQYFRRSLHRFELVCAIGTTVRFLYGKHLYYGLLTYLQILRVIRIIKISPVTEEFVFKIFGPGRKLTLLIASTFATMVLMSAISLQLFCHVEELENFENFLQSFMSIFQVLTQEGWIEVMDLTVQKSNRYLAPFVSFYFIIYHLYLTYIIVSFFVAVILDNLELDEELKRMKQIKAREEKVRIEDKLPVRLEVFNKFSEKPQMSKLNHSVVDYAEPRVRESDMKQFLSHRSCSSGNTDVDLDEYLGDSDNDDIDEKDCNSTKQVRRNKTLLSKKGLLSYVETLSHEKSIVQDVMKSANKQEYIYASSMEKDSLYSTLFSVNNTIQRRVRRSTKYAPADQNDNNNDDQSFSLRDLEIRILQERTGHSHTNAKEARLRENHPLFDTPLLLIPRESYLRKMCRTIITAQFNIPTYRKSSSHYKKRTWAESLFGMTPIIDWLALLSVMISCFAMLFETHNYRLMEEKPLIIIELFFILAMSLELTLKVIGKGLLLTPNAVLKDFAGFFDLFIYITGVLFVILHPTHISVNSFAYCLLLCRVVRPLRVFTLVPQMQKALRELFRGFREIALVSVLLVVLMFIFASYGVQNFAGILYKCNDMSITKRHECVGNFHRNISVVRIPIVVKNDPPSILVPRIWGPPRNFGFDNLGQAMLTLFEALTLEGYVELRDALLEKSALHALYIHVFVFIGSLIGVTLFVGVLIANFQENNGRALLTVDQRRWEDLKRRLSLVQPLRIPPRPRTKYRAILYDIILHRFFKRLMSLAVVAQATLLFVPWDNEEHSSELLPRISCLFNILFGIESLLKCIALSVCGYVQSTRNRYEAIVSIAGIVWTTLYLIFPKSWICQWGSGVVLLRFTTLSARQPTLRMLLKTVAVSIYKSCFIVCGLALLMLTYSLAGVILFGSVRSGENLGRHANFRNVGYAFTVLFRIITGEDWNKIMHDCMIDKPLCKPGKNYWQGDCGNYIAAVVYFCSFYIAVAYICINLLVAVIVENFSLFYCNEEDALLSYADIKHFQLVWNMVDTQRKGYLPKNRVPFVLRLLRGRLEIDQEKDKLLFKHMCYETENHVNNEGWVSFHKVLNMLSYRSVDIRKVLQLEELIEREEREFEIEEEVAKKTIRTWFNTQLQRKRLKFGAHNSLANMIYHNENEKFPDQSASIKPAVIPKFTKKSNRKRSISKEITDLENFNILNAAANDDPNKIFDWWKGESLKSCLRRELSSDEDYTSEEEEEEEIE